MQYVASCKRVQRFFFPEPSPGYLAGVQRVMCTEIESFSASVSRPWPKNIQKHCQSPTKAFAFNINLCHVENACNKQTLCRIHVVFALKFNSSRCSRLLFVTFNIATIVCDGEKEEKREWRSEKNFWFSTVTNGGWH